MEDMTNQVLIDLFTNTPFVGFLVWQYVQMRKDIKEQQEKTEQLRREELERQEQLRARFERVIAGLQDDKDQLVSGLEKRLETVESNITKLEAQIRKLFTLISKFKVRP